jgi:hypothetical protein
MRNLQTKWLTVESMGRVNKAMLNISHEKKFQKQHSKTSSGGFNLQVYHNLNLPPDMVCKTTSVCLTINCDFLSNNLSNHTKRFNDRVNIFQLTQLIDQPTRITEKTASLLDVALVNNPEKISHSGVLHIGISDRSLIVCKK